MSDDLDPAERAGEQAVWIRRYLAPLVGARITRVEVFASGPYFGCRISAVLADGGSVILEVDRDEEGNGPGFLFGLPAPRQAADGSPTPRLDWGRRYLEPLLGCEILGVGAEVHDGGAWPQITVRDGTGTVFALEVSCDEEGNAPGYLAGLDRPGRPQAPWVAGFGQERSMSAVEYREDGAVLLGDPPILKLEPETSFVVVNAGEHPLDARTRELTPEAICAIRDWCDTRIGSLRRDGRRGRKPGEEGEGDA